MALSIGVGQGSRLRIGEHLLEVKQILGRTLMVVSLDKGKNLTVSDKERVELLPGVYVFAGRGGRGVTNRLAFEAPKEFRIERIEASKCEPGV